MQKYDVKSYSLCDVCLQYLPAAVHGTQFLSEISLIAAFALHIRAADLEH